MKIRNGFVSNSSSSSFIIVLDKKPNTVEELKKILFGDEDIYRDPYSETSFYKTIDVAQTVFEDLKYQEPLLTKEEISKEIDSGVVEGTPRFDYFKEKDNTSLENYIYRHRKERGKFADNLAEQLIIDFKEKLLFVLEYADDTSYGCALEHGNLFDNLEYVIRISKH